MNIGFAGLGQMGRNMAARLLDRGHALIVWNRTSTTAEALREKGARVATHAQDVLDAEVVVTMLADDAAIESVWLDSHLYEKLPCDTVHLNMATVSLAMAERLASLHDASGRHYVSAPVFGRPQAAARGELDIVAAGAPLALARCVPLFEALGKQWFDLGADPKHANIVKIARNFLLGTIIESLGEAFALVAKSGVAPARFLEIITATSMNAPAYRNYGRLMIDEPAQPTFTLKLGMKDVQLALGAGAQTGVPMLLAALLREQHLAAIGRGYGDRDWAALGNYIAETAGTQY
ncbi:MAG TPA: NAD(P)-dependent oxidoreductase [Burkholderiales bacterium]|nr:NAD(P)-dependent oxidoreductase [Burkholderiales bacterium]